MAQHQRAAPRHASFTALPQRSAISISSIAGTLTVDAEHRFNDVFKSGKAHGIPPSPIAHTARAVRYRGSRAIRALGRLAAAGAGGDLDLAAAIDARRIVGALGAAVERAGALARAVGIALAAHGILRRRVLQRLAGERQRREQNEPAHTRSVARSLTKGGRSVRWRTTAPSPRRLRCARRCATPRARSPESTPRPRARGGA